MSLNNEVAGRDSVPASQRNTPQWPSGRNLRQGIFELRLRSVDQLVECLTRKFGMKIPDCMFRGQRKHSWPVVSSFDRYSRFLDFEARQEALDRHLWQFKRSIAGRRGANPAQYTDAGEWWALGQHHGLWTPLIDWSRSPWIGLFFALEAPKDPGARRPADRALYCLNWGHLYRLTPDDLSTGVELEVMSEIIDFFECFPEDNARLLSQSGLFSFSRRFDSVEKAIRSLVKKKYAGSPLLVKIRIPEDQRVAGIQLLRSMNINHATLFPDVSGAGLYANALLSVEG